MAQTAKIRVSGARSMKQLLHICTGTTLARAPEQYFTTCLRAGGTNAATRFTRQSAENDLSADYSEKNFAISW